MDRYWVNRNVSLLPGSVRCSGSTGIPGRFCPGLRAAICGLFHVLIAPLYIAACTLPFSFRCPATPGTL